MKSYSQSENRSNMPRRVAVVLTVTLLSVGCVSSGRKIDNAAVEQIEVNKSTRADVERLMGKPVVVMTDTANGTTLTYSHLKSVARPETYIPIAGAFIGGADATSETVTFMLNGAGVVTNISRASTDISTGPGGKPNK